MIRIALIAIVFAACTETGPVVTYALDIPDPELSAEADRALVGWETIGLVRDDASPDIAAIRVQRVPDDSMDVDARTWREFRLIEIRESVAGLRLYVAIAHEIGHGVLDTGRHTNCGIMGSSDWFPCDEDIALACERVGVGCP